jgi:hypothetical protein
MGSDIQWDQATKKKARGKDEYDLGQVQEITSEYVITRNKFEKKIFQLPKRMATSFNGDLIVFDLSEADANSFYLIPEDSSHENYESHVDRTMNSNTTQRKLLTEKIGLKVKETKQGKIELIHEELVIEQKRLPQPREINEQEITEQDSDRVMLKIPLKNQEIKSQ